MSRERLATYHDSYAKAMAKYGVTYEVRKHGTPPPNTIVA